MLYRYYFYSKQNNNDNVFLNKLYNITKNLEKDYPSHYNWFYDKFIKELDGIKREIIYCTINDEPIGIVFLKNDKNEKKICTIMVKEEYRKHGIGNMLLKKSFEFLDTITPMITMPDYKEKCFKKIIEKYHWKKTQILDSYYSNNKELVFNGSLC